MNFVRDHIPALDGLRGLAVLLVVWSHLPSGLLGPVDTALRFAVRPGYLGVDVFFVLSGFLITRILLTDLAKKRSLGPFLMRRFVRIFPIYYLLIFILLVLDPGSYLGWCAAYLSNFYFAVHSGHSPMEHTWSLAVEEHFYLFWPLAVYGLSVANSRRLALWGLIPGALLLAVAAAFFEEHLPAEADAIIYRVTFFRMMSLALGAVLAYAEPLLRGNTARIAKWGAAMLLPAVFIIPCTLLVDHRWVGPIMLLGFSLMSGAILLFTIAANEAQGFLARCLSTPPLCFCGRISYGFYLYHLPIFTVLGVWGFPKGEPPAAATVLLALALAVGVSTLSFFCLERPLLLRNAAWLQRRKELQIEFREEPPTGTHRLPVT